ncbi:ras GTPase-activating-like protein IQGAP2 isoform X1 [Lates japonicus]|uniref:Ras GTPase-activating-like protein IQGAP2 isoform X1 n=1 Tax=Lates japonicus TaxID=270547 RepID=A0AAD3MCH8_LATJO|nr:ras GTPase-activating-like protein IQGAP2 isoform X1 [Lates japonicus]
MTSNFVQQHANKYLITAGHQRTRSTGNHGDFHLQHAGPQSAVISIVFRRRTHTSANITDFKPHLRTSNAACQLAEQPVRYRHQSDSPQARVCSQRSTSSSELIDLSQDHRRYPPKHTTINTTRLRQHRSTASAGASTEYRVVNFDKIHRRHSKRLYLYKLGIAPQIQDLLGKVAFTEEEISNMRSELEKYGIQMPAFSKIGGILANELSVDEAALHAAVIAINEAVDRGQASVTMGALNNPNAMLRNPQEALAQEYQDTLSQAKARKQDQSSGRRSSVATEERDVYEELLTQQEIQSCIDFVNIQAAVGQVNQRCHDPGRELLYWHLN